MTGSEKPSTGTSIQFPVDFPAAVATIETHLWHWHNNNLGIFSAASNKDPVGIMLFLHNLAYHNYQIWHWEDIARCSNDDLVVEAKRNIDPHNQSRNDTIELIDDYYVEYQIGTGPYNSETLGSILDRIAINTLKIMHIAEYPDKALTRIPVLQAQIRILSECGIVLLHEMQNGKRQMIAYKQLKMYNDAETNPMFGKQNA